MPAQAKNGKALLIVESPSKVKTISGYLGEDYLVDSSMGHIRDLPQPSELPENLKKGPYGKFAVDVEDGFEPYYVVNPDKKKKVAELKRKLKEVDALYLATDGDREGEAIAWHLKEVLKPKVPIYRMTFPEITREAIQRAFGELRDIDLHLVDARRPAASSTASTVMKFPPCSGARSAAVSPQVACSPSRPASWSSANVSAWHSWPLTTGICPDAS